MLLPLTDGVEEDVVRIADDPLELRGSVGRCIGVHFPAEILPPHLGLDRPAGADPVQGPGDQREEGRQGEGLEGQQNFGSGPLLDGIEDRAVARDHILTEQVAGSLDLAGVFRRKVEKLPLVLVSNSPLSA